MTTSKTSGRLAEFLDSVRPQIEEIFVRHSVLPERASEILSDTLAILVWRWEAIRNREAWLLAMIERKARASATDRPAQPWEDDIAT
ncbi:MAG TPA: hypothetical protein PK413_14560 [Thermoanaerobaculia bacterium]|nr:hypothetical protein [Thermoanaerobaculia bacterium]